MRKLGGTTLRSIGQVAKLQTIKDNDEDFVPPRDMLRELMDDNKAMAAAMRKAHEIADEHEDPPPRACSRPSSTTPSGAPGSCSKPAARKAATRRKALPARVGKAKCAHQPELC